MLLLTRVQLGKIIRRARHMFIVADDSAQEKWTFEFLEQGEPFNTRRELSIVPDKESAEKLSDLVDEITETEGAIWYFAVEDREMANRPKILRWREHPKHVTHLYQVIDR